MFRIRSTTNYFNGWFLLSSLFIVLMVFPSLNIFLGLFSEPSDNWLHIKEYLLKAYVTNTVIIVVLTGLVATFIGTSLAWLIAMYDFPLRGVFKWGMLLPLAIPPYIAAYTYHGLLNYTGVVQSYLRNSLGINLNPQALNIMSIEGAVFIFSIFLFPYVYSITYAFLAQQSASLIESARVLGKNSFEIFWSVVLPISRVAIVSGASLLMMEVLNDYGVVQYFGIPTFSTAIFRTWFAMGDINSAIRLAGILMTFVIVLISLEKLLRGRKRFSYSTTKIQPLTRVKLSGLQGGIACTYGLVIFALGFIIPTLQLMYWTFLSYEKVLNYTFVEGLINSIFLALLAAAITTVVALTIANYSRVQEGLIGKIYAKISVLGYSIPAAVIAVGVIVFFIGLDNNLYWLYTKFDPETSKLILSSSLVMLTFAYVIRFLAVAFNSIETGFEKVGKNFFEASKMLGMSTTRTFFKVDLPLIKPATAAAFFMVFLDVLKELPLTLLLRPFNFNTLATKTFEYANDEMIHEAAIASLMIILISIVSIYFFNKLTGKEVN